MSEDQVQSNEVDYTLAEKDDRLEGAEEIPLETESIPQEEIDALQHADGTWSIEDLENLSTKAPLVGESTQTDSSGTLEIDYPFAHRTSRTLFGFLCVLFFCAHFILLTLALNDAYLYEFKRAKYSFMCGGVGLISIVLGYVCQIYNIVQNRKNIKSFVKMDCVFGIFMIIIPVLLFIIFDFLFNGHCNTNCLGKQGMLGEYDTPYFSGFEQVVLILGYYIANIPIAIVCLVAGIIIKKRHKTLETKTSHHNYALFIRLFSLLFPYIYVILSR